MGKNGDARSSLIFIFNHMNIEEEKNVAFACCSLYKHAANKTREKPITTITAATRAAEQITTNKTYLILCSIKVDQPKN